MLFFFLSKEEHERLQKCNFNAIKMYFNGIIITKGYSLKWLENTTLAFGFIVNCISREIQNLKSE